MLTPCAHLKQLIHLALLLGIIYSNYLLFTVFSTVGPPTEFSIPIIISLLFDSLILLNLPQCLANFFGLIFYNAFIKTVELMGSPQTAPFLCFRVVTRGDYPELVKRTVQLNLKTCLDVGLENFGIEIATDRSLQLPTMNRVREVVIPQDYKTKTGALFKARALQYCLEDEVNQLNDQDWIVHLDEETLMSESAVRGIVNFVYEDRRDFGQGVITYANEKANSKLHWLLTLADSFRVAEDYGKIRFQFLMLRRPLFGIKGSFLVARFSAEKSVTFDHGPDGSVAEDCYFAVIAFKKGYKFDFIEGAFHERSPFNTQDFVKQRKRWLKGIWLVVHSSLIPIKYKLFLGISVYGWMLAPLALFGSILKATALLPDVNIVWLKILLAFTTGIRIYLFVFGIWKSYDLLKVKVVIMCTLSLVPVILITMVLESVAVISTIWSILIKEQLTFFIVKKDPQCSSG